MAKPLFSGSMNGDATWTFSNLERRKRALVARKAFFARQRSLGNTFRREPSSDRYYERVGDGLVLGITYSSQNENGKWWFNLTEGHFREAVFLCRCGPRSVKVIHLPKDFLDRWQRLLSRNSREIIDGDETCHEVEFTFSKEGQKWLFHVPGPTGALDVTQYAEPGELDCSSFDQFLEDFV